MTSTEIRGSFVSLLAEVDDAATLRQMFQKCVEILRQKDPLAAHFPVSFLAELDEAIAQSDDGAEAVSNDEAFKMFRAWANE